VRACGVPGQVRKNTCGGGGGVGCDGDGVAWWRALGNESDV